MGAFTRLGLLAAASALIAGADAAVSSRGFLFPFPFVRRPSSFLFLLRPCSTRSSLNSSTRRVLMQRVLGSPMPSTRETSTPSITFASSGTTAAQSQAALSMLLKSSSTSPQLPLPSLLTSRERLVSKALTGSFRSSCSTTRTSALIPFLTMAPPLPVTALTAPPTAVPLADSSISAMARLSRSTTATPPRAAC